MVDYSNISRTEWITILILMAIIAIILFIIILSFTIYFLTHNSYHKGYNEARNDDINYYQSLRDLNDSFTKVMKDAKERDLEIDVNFLTNLIDFGNKVREYKNKN